MPRILITDVETTGMSNADEICELAFIEVDQNLTPLFEFQSLVRPAIPISPAASGASHITNEMVADAPSIHEVLSQLPPGYFDDIAIVAHNAPFEYRMLRQYWEISSQLCTLRAAKRYVSGVENYKLQTLRYALDLKVDVAAHRAMADVITAMQLLKKLIGGVGMTLAEMFAENGKVLEISTMPFGKHNGLPLASLPLGYVNWLLNKADIDNDLRLSLLKIFHPKLYEEEIKHVQ